MDELARRISLDGRNWRFKEGQFTRLPGECPTMCAILQPLTDEALRQITPGAVNALMAARFEFDGWQWAVTGLQVAFPSCFGASMGETIELELTAVGVGPLDARSPAQPQVSALRPESAG